MTILLAVTLFACSDMSDNQQGQIDQSATTVSQNDIDADTVFSTIEGRPFILRSSMDNMVEDWMTTVWISADGTFTGSYILFGHDYVADGHTDATRDECYFSGTFSQPELVADNIYSMQCETFVMEGAIGESRMVDGVRVYTRKPAGFYDPGEFLLYTPETRTDDVYEGFRMWMYDILNDKPIPDDTIGYYGLYSLNEEIGFLAP